MPQEIIKLIDFKKRFGSAKGRPPRQVGVMNRTEKAFSELLEQHRMASLITAWWFEAVTLRLAHDLRYTPDFMLMEADNTITLVEVKAAFTNKHGDLQLTSRDDDSKIKIKTASSLFPFRFKLAILKPDKTWEIKEIH